MASPHGANADGRSASPSACKGARQSARPAATSPSGDEPPSPLARPGARRVRGADCGRLAPLARRRPMAPRPGRSAGRPRHRLRAPRAGAAPCASHAGRGSCRRVAPTVARLVGRPPPRGHHRAALARDGAGRYRAHGSSARGPRPRRARRVLARGSRAPTGDRDRCSTRSRESPEPRSARPRRFSELPLPELPSDLRVRVALLRESVAAVARAFAHQPEARDANLLRQAAGRNALIHWPLRYAAAVVCIDQGESGPKRGKLLADAPAWPEDSAFRAFHAELSAYAREPRD